MIVIEIPLQDVIIDVEEDIDLGTGGEEEAILQLTQAHDFLLAPLSVTIEDGIATISSFTVSRHNRKLRNPASEHCMKLIAVVTRRRPSCTSCYCSRRRIM